MTQSLAFSTNCYFTSAFSLYQASTQPIETYSGVCCGQLAEHLKKVVRCLYVLGVSLLIAPCGVVYHVSQGVWKTVQSYRAGGQQDIQGLSERAWKHVKAAERDAFAFIRGGYGPLLSLFFITLFGRMLPYGIRTSNLLVIALGVAGLRFGYHLINRTHLPQAWKSLESVNTALDQERWTKVVRDFDIDICVLAGIILEIRKN